MHEAFLSQIPPEHLAHIANALLSGLIGTEINIDIDPGTFSSGAIPVPSLDTSVFDTAVAPDADTSGAFQEVAAPTAPRGTFENPKVFGDGNYGTDPVGKANGAETAFADAYEGSNPDMDVKKDPSKVMQSARVLAKEQGFSDAKTAAYLEQIQDPDSMKRVKIPNGTKLAMADGEIGGRHSGIYETNFKNGYVYALKGEITYTEIDPKTGIEVTKTETVYVIEGCSNPAVDASPDKVLTASEPVPPPVKAAPASTKCVADWKWEPMSSNQGVDFGPRVGVVHDFDAYHAPTGMTETEALAVLRDKTSAENIALRGHYFWVFTDVDCDGHPEKAECVYIDEDGNLRNSYVRASAAARNYDDLGVEQQKKFLNTP